MVINMAKSREIPAGEFKAKCLKLMDEVAETGEELVITKHGKPVAKLTPVIEGRHSLFGSMRGSVTILGDIVEPVLDPGWDRHMLKSWDELHKPQKDD